jgi:cytochrome c peroxidase
MSLELISMMVNNTNSFPICAVTAIRTLGGPTIPWSSGRTDTIDLSQIPVEGRLPSPDSGNPGTDQPDIDHLRIIFGRMGFNDQEIVALLGAHSLGRCHQEVSGYTGPWTPTPNVFSNLYYVLMRDLTWVQKVWTGPFQYENGGNGRLMMLPTDIALLEDASFFEWVDIYADNSALFFTDFSAAFQKLTELGTSGLTPTEWA